MQNSGSHNFSVITNYQLFKYTERMLYNTTMTVNAGKWFKVLIDSGATISLMCTSVFNMIEGSYKTSILPAMMHLRTVGSPTSSMEKATFHLHIYNFKFSHTFIIHNRILETDLLFWYQPTGLVFLMLLLVPEQTSLHIKRSLIPDLHQKQRGHA